MTLQNDTPDRLGCGCCRGPIEDRCICHIHQDVRIGRNVKMCSRHKPKVAMPPAEELTPIGVQFVIPGCERSRSPVQPRQPSLWD